MFITLLTTLTTITFSWSTLFSLCLITLCPALIILVFLYIPLPEGIADSKKLYVTEMFLRVSGEYLGDIVETALGPEYRNYYLRFIMAIGFYLPAPTPPAVEYSWVELGGVSVRVIRPKFKEHRRNTAIVYIHGGGWATMRPQYYDHALSYLVYKLGSTIFAIDYRLAPEHPYPAAVEDCEAVVRALTDKVLYEYGIVNSRLCVMGDSAGGNLSAVISRRLRDTKRIKCQVLIYPVTTVFGFASSSYKDYFRTCAGTALLNPFSMARWILFYLGVDAKHDNVRKLIDSEHVPRGHSKILDDFMAKDDKSSSLKANVDLKLASSFAIRGLDPDVSPLLAHDLNDLPPTMVLTAGIDVLRDEGRAYAARLAEAGVTVDAKHYPSAYHGILNMPYSRVRKTMKRDIVHFLDKYL